MGLSFHSEDISDDSSCVSSTVITVYCFKEVKVRVDMQFHFLF